MYAVKTHYLLARHPAHPVFAGQWSEVDVAVVTVTVAMKPTRAALKTSPSRRHQ